ncbi:MAG: hypothetical protein AAB394_00670 [Patescibacteria group bacterium]
MLGSISGTIIVVGAVAIFFGAFDLWVDSPSNWKKIATKIVGGVVVVCIGMLMKKFGL